MATPSWQPGKLYPPGSLVVPRTTAPNTIAPIPNGDFEAGNTGWILEANGDAEALIVQSANAYAGSWCAGMRCPAHPGVTLGSASIAMDTPVPMSPGGRVTLTAMVRVTQGGTGVTGTAVVQFLDTNGDVIPNPPHGNAVDGSGGRVYKPSVVTNAIAPAGTVAMRAAVYFTPDIMAPGSVIVVDNLSWTYQPPSSQGIQYKAVQASAGYSGTSEPTWPPTVGATVVDNEVTWEAVRMSRIVWMARPIMKSGPNEPAWPTEHGAFVADNTISWEAVDLRITDENCPNSKVVVIAKSKIYAGDKDVVRYSATLNPRDWTSMEDAGYIGTGLQQNGANDVAVMNLYRGNLIVMNAPMFQQWNIDPDPALTDLLDTMEGIGSVWHLAAQPVANDLFYLSALGVRTIGLSGATNNLKSGDVGLPVDPMVQLLVREAQELGEQPLGMYYPASGQYWLIFNREADDDGSGVSPIDLCPTLQVGQRYAEVMVYTLNQIGQVGAWTRYVFPFAIDYAAIYGNDLFVRDGDTVFLLSEMIGACDFYSEQCCSIENPVDHFVLGENVCHYYRGAGGVPPYAFEIIAGSLPPGLSMDASGRIIGVPEELGSYSWTVSMTGLMDSCDEPAILEQTVLVVKPYVPCGSAIEYTGGQSFPVEVEVFLGSDTGTVELEFATGIRPDKFDVYIDDVLVHSSGYYGDVSFQAELDAALAARGLPPETIIQFNGTVPLEDQWANPNTRDRTSFEKVSDTPVATVKVWAPLGATRWIFQLGCPTPSEEE